VQIPQMKIGAAGLRKTHASAASRMTNDSGVSTSQGDEKLSALDRTGWDIPTYFPSKTLSLDRMDRKVAVGAIEEVDLSYRKDNGCTA
jgi:hypothetical protein